VTSRPLEIPGDGPWFEGHFPGRPILPGIAALALIVEALDGKPVQRIVHARFRQVIGPGERLTLTTAEGPAGATRVALSRGGAPVLQAEVVFGTPATAPPSSLVAATPLETPPLDRLLPHRAPMRFVDAVFAEHGDGVDCGARIPSACAVVRGATAPAFAALEACAQTAAMWEALRRGREAGAATPRVGYLVGFRDVTLHRAAIAAEAPFVTRVRLEAAALPLTHYRAEAALDGASLLTGTFATVLA
jgi:3-hydroxymyristoyl/3-hydroxydecanoyl-(acyl carrier protein) dehydratase